MTVTFYNNSSDPSTLDKIISNPRTYAGEIVSPFDILRPVLRFQMDSVPDFNYAYIAETGRYYFVTDAICGAEGIWDISFNADPLTSWKTEIRQNYAFVLSNQYTYNSMIPNDTLQKENRKITTIISNAISIVSQPGYIYPWKSYSEYISTGSTEPHFVLSSSPILVDYAGRNEGPPKHGLLLSITDSLGQQRLATEFEVNNIIDSDLDFSDFIHEFYYFPIMPTTNHLTVLTKMYYKKNWLDTLTQNTFITKTFDTNFAVGGNYYVAPNEDNYIVRSRWVLPLTDAAPNNAKFLLGAPYTNYILHFLPFPDVTIDPSLFIDSSGNRISGLGVEVIADYRSGDAQLYIATADPASTTGDFGDRILMATANLKVPLPVFSKEGGSFKTKISDFNNLSYSKTQHSTETTKLASFAGEVIPIAEGLNIGAKIAKDVLLTGYSTTCNGSAGSMIEDSEPTLRVETYDFTTPAPSTLGLPLHEERLLSTLSGLTVCGACHLEGLSNALDSEIKMIETALQSGVIL